MMRRIRETRHSESGFTLIELLVVVLILGILAAIAVPSFINQRTKAQDAEAKSYARTAQTAAETYATDNDGVYTGVSPAELVTIEPTMSNATALAASSAAAGAYVVSADSSNGTTFTITRAADGTFTRTCDNAGSGGCQDDGAGGGTW